MFENAPVIDGHMYFNTWRKGVDKFVFVTPLDLNFDVYPVALFEAGACEEVTGYLVCENAHPDSDDAPMEDVAAYIGEDGTDDGNTKHRAFGSVFGVASASETAHVDYLGNLEEDGYDNDVRDVDTNLNNMWFLWEEETKQVSSE